MLSEWFYKETTFGVFWDDNNNWILKSQNMSKSINNDNNEENDFNRIFFRVQNQIELFEKESLSIWKGFENIQKIHGDIIKNFQSK